MTIQHYKESIKQLIDSTNNEDLLKHWKKQLEYDLQNKEEVQFTTEESELVQEGIADYGNGEVLSLEDFISKRK